MARGADKTISNSVFGIVFSAQNLYGVVDRLTVTDFPEAGRARMLFTANLDHIVKMRTNPDFLRAYKRASIVTADGAPVYLYVKLRGANLPQRVTGADLFPVLMKRLDPNFHRPFFVVSDDETASRITAALGERRFGHVEVAVPPFGFEKDTAYSQGLARRIAEFETTHLFFCVGAPKSELWIDRHADMLGPCYAMALGAGANFFAKTSRRAPRWVSAAGFEWLWRFLSDPKRLFRRYFIDSWGFLLAVFDDLRHKYST